MKDTSPNPKHTSPVPPQSMEEKKGKTSPKNRGVGEGDRSLQAGVSPKDPVKKSSNALGLLAILLTLGVSAVGGYVVFQHAEKVQQQWQSTKDQLQNLSQDVQQLGKIATTFHQISEKFSQLEQNTQALADQVTLLDNEIKIRDQAINALQIQINRLNTNETAQPAEWKLAEAHYLLRLAQQQLLSSQNVPAIIALLQQAEQILAKIDNANVLAIRTALNDDLKALMAVKTVNEPALMWQLSHLTEQIPHLMPLSLRHKGEDEPLSDSVKDWQANLQKSATAFLNQFIRATPKGADSQALITPEQEIYLRENLRLRLQIALLAVARHQEPLYRQSLNMVADWVRRYFDGESPEVQAFLARVQTLQAEDVAMPLASELKSLSLMDRLMNKATVL